MAPLGIFYDENWNVIGNDGKNDGKEYMIKTTKKSFIAYNEKTGQNESFNADGITNKQKKRLYNS